MLYIEDLNYTIDIMTKILNTPSPSGYCKTVMTLVEDEINKLGLPFEMTNKGNGIITLPYVAEAGKQDEMTNNINRDQLDGDCSEGGLLISAHLDTLGAMVRSIKSDGKIRFTSVGGYAMPTVEGEYCTVHTRDGKEITGTVLNTMPSVHVFEEARTQERKESAMEIRLDEVVETVEGVKALGIEVGDYISFDPRVKVTESGFIKSRHLDDKAGVAAIIGALKYIVEEGISFNKPIKVMLSTFEEVGHGSSYVPEGITEVLAIDMGAIGDDLSCTEKDVSICVKDSSGPYDYDMVGRLTEIAKELELSYKLDVYPRYSSDASAALHGGHNIRAALMGPGIHGSHSMERTHKEAVKGTLNLLTGYLMQYKV